MNIRLVWLGPGAGADPIALTMFETLTPREWIGPIPDLWYILRNLRPRVSSLQQKEGGISNRFLDQVPGQSNTPHYHMFGVM